MSEWLHSDWGQVVVHTVIGIMLVMWVLGFMKRQKENLKRTEPPRNNRQ